MYFIKIYSNNYKNSLQKGIEETFKPLNHMLVADPVEFLKHVQQKVTELNAKNPRAHQPECIITLNSILEICQNQYIFRLATGRTIYTFI